MYLWTITIPLLLFHTFKKQLLQVNLSQVKAKVGEILARCGQQDVEKTCKWFLLWHNRSDIILSSSLWGKELQKKSNEAGDPTIRANLHQPSAFPSQFPSSGPPENFIPEREKVALGQVHPRWTQDPDPTRNGRKVELSNCLGTETLVGRKQSKLFRETFLYLRYKSELFPLKFRIPQFIRIK